MSSELPPGSDAGRAFVQSTQERYYRRLAIAQGWDLDPVAAHARFMGSTAIPDRVPIDPLKSTLRNDPRIANDWHRFDATVQETFARYYSRPLPTPLEDPVFHPMLMMLLDRYHTALAGTRYGLEHQPLLATLPSGRVNAITWPVPDTDLRAIFFEQGLFRYFDHIATCVGWALPPLAPGRMVDDAAILATEPRYTMPSQASSLLGSVLVTYVTRGTPPRGTGELPRPPHNLPAVTMLLAYMEQFALVHELGHLMNHDVERFAQHQVAPWKAEYQADTLAAHMVTALAYKETGTFAMAFAGCDLALTAMHFLDRALAIVQHGSRALTWVSPTHPDALSRRDSLREEMPAMPQAGTEVARSAAITLCNMTDALLGRLWEIVSLELLMQAGSGHKPSPIWRDYIKTSFAVAADATERDR
jgi:hypothetical protein